MSLQLCAIPRCKNEFHLDGAGHPYAVFDPFHNTRVQVCSFICYVEYQEILEEMKEAHVEGQMSVEDYTTTDPLLVVSNQ